VRLLPPVRFQGARGKDGKGLGLYGEIQARKKMSGGNMICRNWVVEGDERGARTCSMDIAWKKDVATVNAEKE